MSNRKPTEAMLGDPVDLGLAPGVSVEDLSVLDEPAAKLFARIVDPMSDLSDLLPKPLADAETQVDRIKQIGWRLGEILKDI